MNSTDLLIIGGGINGVGIAADAAGRGLKVSLCEQSDLASATSSKSTKLIHGGLRYLQYGEFRLVKEALQEREILLQKAPHLIHPLRFIMPHNPRLKPAWLIRIGLFLYDHLAKRQRLPLSATLVLKNHPLFQLLQKNYSRGFAYSDCWVDDARLVVSNAIAAKEKGAAIYTYTRFISAKRTATYWEALLENTQSKTQFTVQATALINTAGPWVEEVLQKRLNLPSKNQLKLVKGSHIIVPKLYADTFALTLTHSDNRVIFVIPYLQHYSLIGTTDRTFSGDLCSATIDADEINYLCQAVNQYLSKPISAADVISSYAGVRPLHNESAQNLSAISRDYAFELNTDQNQAPLLSVFGGKITTYRKLAEQALEKLKAFFPQMGPAWTEQPPLPGGQMANANFETFRVDFTKRYPWLPMDLANRYAYQYGSRAPCLLQDAQCLEELGKDWGAGLYQQELNYLIEAEWAKTAEDVLWRRTKLGLALSTAQIAALTHFLAKRATDDPR